MIHAIEIEHPDIKAFLRFMKEHHDDVDFKSMNGSVYNRFKMREGSNPPVIWNTLYNKLILFHDRTTFEWVEMSWLRC